MSNRPHTHETFCTIDAFGFVTTHDTLEEAEALVDLTNDREPTHLYIGRFVPFRPHRLTLRQARWCWTVGLLAASVLLDVAVPEYVLFWH